MTVYFVCGNERVHEARETKLLDPGLPIAGVTAFLAFFADCVSFAVLFANRELLAGVGYRLPAYCSPE